MIVHDVLQGTPEWLKCRLGIPTASNFDKIITSSTRKRSASADKYMHQLLAEWLLGEPMESPDSAFMARGTEMEPEAVAWYAWTKDVEPVAVGFCTTDDGRIGCSPDRLIGDDGLLEVKCPGAVQHVANILTMTDDYTTQVQGQMFVTGRKWVDLMSYNPAIGPACVRVFRDEEYIDDLECALTSFMLRLAEARHRLLKLGYAPKVVDGD